MTLNFHRDRNRFAQALSVLCVFLVIFVASVQAAHVHPDTVRHDCSICSIAHAGAIATAAFEGTPVFRSAAPVAEIEPRSHSCQFIPSYITRPPPSV